MVDQQLQPAVPIQEGAYWPFEGTHCQGNSVEDES